jgi:hypothetical protein
VAAPGTSRCRTLGRGCAGQVPVSDTRPWLLEARPGVGHLAVAFLAVLVVALCVPTEARANGDPASDYLLGLNLFLPFGAKIDSGEVKRLNSLLDAAKKDGFPIRVAVILTPQDLGTAFSLYNKPQRYAEFLGLELSLTYSDRLLVVMPKGFGYAVNGNPDAKVSRILKTLPAPGRDAMNEVKGATAAVLRLATAAGHHIQVRSGGSQAKDRVMIAVGAAAGLALVTGLLLYRRNRRTLQG